MDGRKGSKEGAGPTKSSTAVDENRVLRLREEGANESDEVEVGGDAVIWPSLVVVVGKNASGLRASDLKCVWILAFRDGNG